MTIWVFGDSLSTAHGLDNDNASWPQLLAQMLGTQCINFARSAADNLYVYHCYLFNLPRIKSQDIVVIGWTHPSRKSFVFDDKNSRQVESLERSFVYDATDTKFIRSHNAFSDTLMKWSDLKPGFKNNPYYDVWFRDYYSETEQKTNLSAYYHAVKSSCPSLYVPFFFSAQSIQGLDLHGAGHAVDFIADNDCAISDQDAHFNTHGHLIWAEQIYQYILSHRKQSLFPVIELLDRLAIARIKNRRVDNSKEVEYYQVQANALDLTKVSQQLKALEDIHDTIWELEKELKSGCEQKLSLEDIGNRAIQIRNWNNKRVALKNQMASMLDCPIREIKRDHLSQ